VVVEMMAEPVVRVIEAARLLPKRGSEIMWVLLTSRDSGICVCVVSDIIDIDEGTVSEEDGEDGFAL